MGYRYLFKGSSLSPRMKLIKKDDKKWLDKEGYSKKIFLTEKDLNSPGNHVQLIKIKPHETAKNHYHKIQTEIFYFLNKNGFFIVNGKKFPVEEGDIIVIEPNDRHEVVNNTDNDFLYLAFKIKYNEDDFYWE